MQSNTKQTENNQLTQPKILYTSANASTSDCVKPEKPMMLNAWTQTTSDDFLDVNGGQECQKEKEYLEKIRMLEENLLAKTELLLQIHESSAPKICKIPSAQQHNKTELESRRTKSVINTVQEPPTESVNYTIIADSNGASGEPIEIQLAEDESTINMNTSADSGRLEICLNEENIAIKNETTPTATFAENMPPMSILKRRKIEVSNENHAELPSDNNCYFNDESIWRQMPAVANSTVPKESKISLLKNRKSETQSQVNLEQKTGIDNVMVSIGPNNTRIPAKMFENMSWENASIATRKLLVTIFDRQTLATHSMTGKPSPAFKEYNKPQKEKLNPNVIKDIIFAVTHKCNVPEKEVRSAITTKCADENKMMRQHMRKEYIRRSLPPERQNNKENYL